MKGRRSFRVFKYLFCTVMALASLIKWKLVEAAISVDRPTLLEGGADASKVNQATQKTVEFLLTFVYSGGIIAVIIGLLMCIPVIGQTQKGMSITKAAVLVLVVAGLIDVIFGFLGGLF